MREQFVDSITLSSWSEIKRTERRIQREADAINNLIKAITRIMNYSNPCRKSLPEAVRDRNRKLNPIIDPTNGLRQTAVASILNNVESCI